VRVTKVSTRVVNAEMRNWVFVRVETDDPGLFGWGEATLEWKTKAVVGAIEDLAPLLIGRDPRDIEQAVRVMTKHSFWRLGAIGMSAISGIELALWDILGKHLDVPVWRLLGGKVRDKVGVYTHLGMGDMRAVYESNEVMPMVERAREVVEHGYKAFKVVIVPYTHFHAPLPQIDKVASMMAALREAVGDDVEIMVDCHGRPASAAAALSYIDALAPSRPMFVEEPLPPYDFEGLAVLVQRTSVPLASGERLVDRAEFNALLGAGIAIAQPDICHCGGLLEAKKIAAQADARGVGVAPHNPLGPIAGAAALHFAVSTPNHVIQEEMVGAVPWYFDVVQGPIKRTDGYWMVPEASGLGISVDEAECAKHPYAPEVLHTTNAVLEDGTIVDW
jgi:galactonate dehydratase